MNKLILPPSPNWYESNISTCAPDNTLIFGARSDIIILENNDPKVAANVRVISRAHTLKILCVNINKNWGQPHKLIVSLSDDKIIKVWDVESCKKLYSHNKHLSNNKVIGVTFAGDERVISVSEDGMIVIWNLPLNETNIIKELLGPKVSVTCISTCPHASWLTAFGLRNGLVIVTDLRRSGKVLYKMRGHDKSVISLSWCPVPINIFPKNPYNFVGQKKIDDGNKEVIVDSKLEEPNLIDFQVCPHLLKMYGYDEDDEKYLQMYLLKEWEFVDHKILDLPISNQPESDIANKSSEEKLDVLIKSTNNVDSEINDTDTSNQPEGDITNKSSEEKLDVLIKSTNNVDSEINDTDTSNQPKGDITNKSSEEKLDVLIKTTNNVSSEINDTDISNQPESDVTNKSSDKKLDVLIKTTNNVGVEIDDTDSNIDKIVSNTDTELNKSKTCEDVGREIVSTKPIPVEEEPRKEFLLASSAKEGNIYIWRAGTDGRMQTFLTIPNKSNYRKTKHDVDKMWITLCWISPTILLSSSKSSELLAWTLPKPQDHAKAHTVIHRDHSSLLFSIAAPIQLLNEYNWKETTELNAWTTSQDRLLLNTRINSARSNLACYPTFAGNIQSIQLSPLDPNRLVIGTSDGFIKLWDLSLPHTNNIIMTTFYQKIQGKVSAMAWHPNNEHILAFGTSEGRVGYIDTSNKSKMPVLLPHFKSEVYKVEWAPVDGNKQNLGLYAVAEGNLVLFDVNKSPKDPIEIEKPQKTFIYSFAWKPDYSLLLLTTKTGFLIVYSPDMNILCKHYFQYRINDIVWHPNASVVSTKESNWFATISNTRNVIVYDFKVESGNNDDNIINMYQGGASDMINAVAWNPYDPSQLVISCEVGVVQVWDVQKNEVLSTFINQSFEGVLAAIWSPIDPDFMISAGKDSTLRVWKISEHPPLTEKEILSQKKTILKELTTEASDLLPKIEPTVEETIKVKKPVKNAILPKYYAPKNSTQTVLDLKKLLLWVENPSAVETKIGDNCEIDILNIFGANQDMINLISLNEVVHKQKGKYSLHTTLSLFRGDISTSIKEAIQEKRVTLGIISLAPMVSPKLWQAACETYAGQLSEESNSDPLEIATFYLACHKVEKAVDCLCDALLFREALALAKCRMLDKKKVDDIISKWATYSVQTGNFEIAAQCNIYLGKYEEAATVLFRRTDLELLEFAMELAEKAGNAALQNAVQFRYNAFRDTNSNKTEVQLPSRQEVVINENKIETEIKTSSENIFNGLITLENDKEENAQNSVENQREINIENSETDLIVGKPLAAEVPDIIVTSIEE